jgi:hypothetical protein
MHQQMTNMPVRPRIASAAEAAEFLADLGALLESLLKILEDETALVRAGRLREAAQLEKAKAELAGKYYAATERLKANGTFLRANLPAKLDDLKHRHEMFRSFLQINLTVLATAHAVSEGIVRGVAGEITRKAAPSIYGASGRATAPAPSAARPVTLSRSL